MLTADLALSFRRGDQIRPRLLDARDGRRLEEAAGLVSVFREHAGRARRELDEALQEYVGTGTNYRVLRGMIKLLIDRCEFEGDESIEPQEIRRALFTAARAAHPVVTEEARAAVAAEAARTLALAPEQLLAGLYADLPANQRLNAFQEPTPEELVHDYNLAQAQALLYRSVEMRLHVEPQTAEGYRELFGAIKAYRLIHAIRGDARQGYEVSLTGPLSMFHRSQKYGVQMAVFLPALLLCAGWRMRAEIDDRRGVAYFELDSRQTVLRSNLSGVTPYRNPAVEKLAESWSRAGCEWSLEEGREVVSVGDAAFVPDFLVTHPSGRVVYLEILGFWTPRHVEERLAEFERCGVRNFVVAAWEELRGTREPLARVPPNVIIFKKNLDPSVVELVVNRLVSEGA
ncbi:MAG TPA: DUF790 family protein [Pyrinomonadaceae bacterium]|nr:DUF790 family protein [Pyrinomonadaceae bacterium]